MMNKRSSHDIAFVGMIRILVFIVIGVLNQHSVLANRFCNNNPSPPSCADDCSGNGFYLSQDGTRCIQCQICKPGQELNKICGDGLNGDAECEPCQEGFYSAHRARRCMPCRVCTNTVELKACESTSDRVCGDCIPGYLRSQDRFGDPDACPLRCQDHSADTPGCEDWWREQIGGDSGGFVEDRALPLKDQPPPQEYDDELCESTPPQCEDDCHGNRLYLGRDGLCKLCLQCQPGYELDKDCGNGINGDAECRSCKEGTFSADGRGACIPCRICVNTEELTGCEPTSDRQCGDCLPGYFQAAQGFFPDSNACPNSCAENPRDTPECTEWWQRQDQMVTSVERLQNSGETEEVHQLPQNTEETVVFQKGENQGKDTQIAKERSTSLHHTSYMTVITVLASLLIVVVVIVILALVVLKIYLKNSRPRDTVINDAGGPLLNRSGNSTPETATPDMANSRSSPRIYKGSPPSPASQSNKPQYLEKINQGHVQGALPYLIDKIETNTADSSRCHSQLIQEVPDSNQSLHASDRKALMIQVPSPLLKSGPSELGSSTGRGDAVFYNSEGNGTTHSVQDKKKEGTMLRRRSSVIAPPTPEGIQVLRRNSIQLYHLANNGRREELNGDCVGRTDSLDTCTAQKEPEAALFPVDSAHEADDRETRIVDKLNQHQDIEQGRNSQHSSFQDGQGIQRRRDPDLDTGARNTGKTMTDSPNQIKQGRLERASTIDNPRKVPIGQKHRGQHPSSTSFTITSESPVININVRSPKVTNMQVGDVYHEHHDGTQDALLGPDDDVSDQNQDGRNDEEEEDQLLYNT